MLKLNRGIAAVLSVFFLNAIAAPTAWAAISDEVAVQLLERLSELEQEVNNLRGENEVMRRELLTIRSAQRTGFLDVDRRVSQLEKKQLTRPTPVTNSQAVNQITVQTNNVPTSNTSITNGDAVTIVSPSPAQGTIVARPTPVTPAAPVPEIATNTGNNQTAARLSSEDVTAQRRALAPVAPEQTTAVKDEGTTSDNSDSYYYYGTQDKNATPATSNTNTASKTSLAEKPVTEKPKAIPSAHQSKAAYNQAYKLLVNDPASAIPAFRDFMKDHPTHELVANAQYWLGEALYAQKDYSGATEEFMKVLKNYKGSPKAPGAALKLGYSFYELRQWDFARRTLEDTVRFFPETNAAKLATNRLKRMANEGR